SDGGLPAVRAKGFELADRGLVQVSMNMVDYRKTSLVQAFEAIRSLAAREGVEIAESEIIGLVPLDALVNGATQYFKLVRFHREQLLETLQRAEGTARPGSSSPPPPLRRRGR